MRISPKQFLHGLIYLAPVTLLALASCGGGGGGSGSNTTLTTYSTLSVNVTGISGVTNAASGVVLRNGGDTITNPTITAPGVYAFAHQVPSGSTYNISVLSQPTPTQLCTFAGGKTTLTATMPTTNTTVNMSCAPAFKIGGNISGINSDGLVLQNNGKDNLQIYAASGSSQTFTFSTPVTSSYNVTMLTPPLGVGQTCSISPTGTNSTSSNISTVSVTCSTSSATPDPFVYAANSASTSNVYAFKSTNGTLSAITNGNVTWGSGRAAIAADRGGKFVLIASGTTTGNVESYTIGSTGALTKVGGVASGNTPYAIAIHPSGNFAYVVNKGDNSVSAYSLATDGTLASIDANGATAVNDPTIATGYLPIAIAIDPTGTYAYVLSAGSYTIGPCGHVSPSHNGCISAYSINSTTGALTSINVSGSSNYIDTGVSPSSIAIDPAGKFVYVTNQADNTVSEFALNSADGKLTAATQATLSPSNLTSPPAVLTSPSSIAFYPDGTYAYVTYASGSILAFPRNTSNGVLNTSTYIATATGTTPNSVSIDSSGGYAYVANYGDGTVWSYSIAGGVTLTKVSSLPAGTGTVAVITAP